jgi:hypothetical protein
MAAFGARFPRHAANRTRRRVLLACCEGEESVSSEFRGTQSRLSSRAHSCARSRVASRPDRLRPRQMRSRVPCPKGAAASRTEVHLAQSLDSFPAENRRVHRLLPLKEHQVSGRRCYGEPSLRISSNARGVRVARASRRRSEQARPAGASRSTAIGSRRLRGREGRPGRPWVNKCSTRQRWSAGLELRLSETSRSRYSSPRRPHFRARS